MEKINRVTKLIEKREKMSMAEFCEVREEDLSEKGVLILGGTDK